VWSRRLAEAVQTVLSKLKTLVFEQLQYVLLVSPLQQWNQVIKQELLAGNWQSMQCVELLLDDLDDLDVG
jgi:hypothetical protein